ncbi:hypothetical protein J6590_023981 [Homalodisca vitripennis]|nr:hypothetical protein J6590_023981 [Homalodisca vitripennis]
MFGGKEVEYYNYPRCLAGKPGSPDMSSTHLVARQGWCSKGVGEDLPVREPQPRPYVHRRRSRSSSSCTQLTAYNSPNKADIVRAICGRRVARVELRVHPPHPYFHSGNGLSLSGPKIKLPKFITLDNLNGTSTAAYFLVSVCKQKRAHNGGVHLIVAAV